jgi:hypothetical protein
MRLTGAFAIAWLDIVFSIKLLSKIKLQTNTKLKENYFNFQLLWQRTKEENIINLEHHNG